MWRTLFSSVAGTSHRRDGRPCQDAARVWSVRDVPHSPLLLVVADGAGSASHAEVGARLACRTALRVMRDSLGTEPEEAVARRWADAVHDALDREAGRLGLTPRDLACTLLAGRFDAGGSLVLQVGDGAIVVGDGAGEYQTVFWPDNGEYPNVTRFVSDRDYADHARVARLGDAAREVAAFSDGLQDLALRRADRSVHTPFFRPMFSRLRAAPHASGLVGPMRRFLDSAAVNARTDDDKTLVLALREDAGR